MLPASYLIQKQKKAQEGQIALIIAISLVILISGFIYFVQINSLVSQGYLVRQYQNELNQLKEECKKMQIDNISLQSDVNFEGVVKNLNLVPIKDAAYLKTEQEEIVVSQAKY